MYFGLGRRLANKCLQLNPKFPLIRRRFAMDAATTARICGPKVAGTNIGGDLNAAAFRLCREGKPLHTFPDHALADELGTELAADAPGQPALTRATFGEDQGEFRWRFEKFGDDLYTPIRNVGNHAVARQAARPELDLRKASANTTFASTTVRCQHINSTPFDADASGIG
jgi:hypothetical protein